MPEQRRIQMTPGDDSIPNRELRDGNFSSDDSSRVGEVDTVMRSLRGVGQDERCSASTAPCAPCALAVVGDTRRDVVQNDRLQISHVNAHLEGRGATEHVDVTVDETVLIFASGFWLKLR